MRNKRIFFIGTLLIAFLSMQGCAVGLIAAGVGAARMGTAKKMEAQSKNRIAYNQYVMEMHKLNLQRQKLHLKPEPILTFKDYMVE